MRFFILVLLLASSGLHADSILVIGDSWASPMVPELQAVLQENGYTGITVVATPTRFLASALASSKGLADISTWLDENPDVTVVQLVTGENDWADSSWEPYWAGTQQEDDLFADITNNVAIAVDRIHSLRPDVQVLWSGYDFPRPITILGGHLRNPAVTNAFLIRLAEQMKLLAMATPGLSFVDLNGTLQVTFGFDGIEHTPYDPGVVIPPGDPSLPNPDFPSPFDVFQPGNQWHLTSSGYKALAQAQFDGYYSTLLDGQKFLINPGLNDAWTNPETPGQGFFITVFPDIAKIFLAWFTYDTERPPQDVTSMLGDPGHRWLTAFGSYADNQAVLDIEVTQGGIFDASNPVPTQGLDGTIILEFSDCNTGTVSYDITSIDLQGVIPIERIALDNVPLCESMQEQLQASK